MARLSIPLEPSFDTLPLSSLYSAVTFPLCGSALTDTIADNSEELPGLHPVISVYDSDLPTRRFECTI